MISAITIEKAKQNASLQTQKNNFRDYYTRGLGQCEDKEGMIRKIQEFRKSELAKEIQDFCMPELEGNPQEECDYYISHEDWSSVYKDKVWGLCITGKLTEFQKQIRKRYNEEKRVYSQFYMPLYGIARHKNNPSNLMEPSCTTILESQYKRLLKQISIVLSMPKEKWDKYEIRRMVCCLEVAECPYTDNSDPEKRFPR